MDRFNLRDIPVARAAELIGVTRGHLDLIIHKAGPMAELVSDKDKHRRFFSRRDCAVLKLAYAFERFGMTWLFAISDAIEAVDAEPQPDEHVIVTCGRSLPRVRRKLNDRDVSKLPLEEATLIVPAGRYVASLRAA